mmetsp:Transcript_1806/g.2498  ORF Transcript_1806/g.2498 Transcript_1806/m.2498 type:complete len:288 (+) Transcript_1806:2-865(+)
MMLIFFIATFPLLEAFYYSHSFRSRPSFLLKIQCNLEGLSANSETRQILLKHNLGAEEVSFYNIKNLQELGISLPDCAIVMSWSKRVIKDNDIKNAIKKREANRKIVSIKLPDKILRYNFADEQHFQRILSGNRILGLKEAFKWGSLSEVAIISLEDAKNDTLYYPDTMYTEDVELLRQEIFNLTRSKTEFDTKKHLKEYFQLQQLDEVEYMGSDIKLELNGKQLGDVDTLYRINSTKTFVLLERKTTLAVNSTDLVMGQIERTRSAFHKVLSQDENSVRNILEKCP